MVLTIVGLGMAAIGFGGLGFIGGYEWNRRVVKPEVHIPPERRPAVTVEAPVDDYTGSVASVVYARPHWVRQAVSVAVKAVKRVVWDGPSEYVRRHRSRWSRPFKRWTAGRWPAITEAESPWAAEYQARHRKLEIAT